MKHAPHLPELAIPGEFVGKFAPHRVFFVIHGYVKSAMRAFASTVTLILAALLVAAVLAYPAWELVGLISPQPIHRVLHRIAMLVVILGGLWLLRRWQLFHRHALGFGQSRRIFVRQVLGGLAGGTVAVLPLAMALYVFGVRAPKPDLIVTTWSALHLVATGLLSGLVVASIEETFFRGVLFTAIRRESGTVAAVILPSLLYAAVHFLGGRLRLPADQIDWTSGFAVLENMLIQYSRPGAMIDSFLALFAVGALLAWARVKTRSIAVPIGLHAAGVCVISFLRETTTVQTQHGNAWLVGSYDGVLGWGALLWVAMLSSLAYLTLRAVQAMHTDKDLEPGGEQRA